MSTAGLCQICQSERAHDRCDRCGTLACREHLDPELAVCVECRAETGRGEGRSHPEVDEYQY